MVEKEYECRYCPADFHKKEALDEHTRLRHSDKVIRPRSNQELVYEKIVVDP